MAEPKPTTALGKEDEVVKVFKRFDSNGDGKISASEIGGLVRALGTEATPEEVRLMMEEMDLDRDGFVDLKEFSDFFSRRDEDGGGGGAAGAERELMEAFKMYDLDGNGRISARELHRVMKMLGEKCSVRDCAKMISSVDVDGDGCVDYKEFKCMMTNGLGGSSGEKDNNKKKKKNSKR